MTIRELGFFIIELYNEIEEEELYSFYLHKVENMNYEEWKKWLKKENETNNMKVLTKEEEKEITERNNRIVKPRKKVGE